MNDDAKTTLEIYETALNCQSYWNTYHSIPDTVSNERKRNDAKDTAQRIVISKTNRYGAWSLPIHTFNDLKAAHNAFSTSSYTHPFLPETFLEAFPRLPKQNAIMPLFDYKDRYGWTHIDRPIGINLYTFIKHVRIHKLVGSVLKMKVNQYGVTLSPRFRQRGDNWTSYFVPTYVEMR